MILHIFFFFQAEDGIRDADVTGVQTCALPIYRLIKPIQSDLNKMLILLGTTCIPFILDYFSYTRGYGLSMGLFIFSLSYVRDFVVHLHLRSAFWEIGRASCRERV